MSLQNKADWIHEVINHIVSAHAQNGDETEVIMVSIDVMKALLDQAATVSRQDPNMPLGIQKMQYWAIAGCVEIRIDYTWPEDCIQGKTKDEYEADRFFNELLSD